MNFTLSSNPEAEKALLIRAKERGMSLDEPLREVVERELAVAPTST